MSIATAQQISLEALEPGAHEGGHEFVANVAHLSPDHGAAPQGALHTFQAALQQAAGAVVPAQAAALDVQLGTAGLGNLGQYAAGKVLELVEQIHSSRKKITETLKASGSSLSPKHLLEMQEALDTFAVASQLLSKVVSSAGRQIDTLTRMQ